MSIVIGAHHGARHRGFAARAFCDCAGARAIWAVRLGQDNASVESFYGAPGSIRSPAATSGAGVVTYRVHGGTLVINYDAARKVVAVETTSSYYFSHGRISVGSRLPNTRLAGRRCPHNFYCVNGSAGFYVSMRSDGASVTAESRFSRPVMLLADALDGKGHRPSAFYVSIELGRPRKDDTRHLATRLVAKLAVQPWALWVSANTVRGDGFGAEHGCAGRA